MSKRKILVIEDEIDMLDLVSLRLRKEGYEVLTADDGERGLHLARNETPELIVLDLMLPTVSGLDVLRRLRDDRRTAPVPVIIVSAKGEESDIVVGLELGADDYVTKPFSMSILVARVNALLRRTSVDGLDRGSKLQVGPIEIDIDRHMASVDGDTISLTRTEFRLLVALASARGRVLTRNQLIDQAIGSDAVVTDRTVDVHLTALRGKLGEARSLIETVRGVGYRMSTLAD